MTERTRSATPSDQMSSEWDAGRRLCDELTALLREHDKAAQQLKCAEEQIQRSLNQLEDFRKQLAAFKVSGDALKRQQQEIEAQLGQIAAKEAEIEKFIRTREQVVAEQSQASAAHEKATEARNARLKELLPGLSSANVSRLLHVLLRCTFSDS
jgi:chromosome segregation ATPase